MSIGASGHLGHNGHFGANGDQEKYAPGQMGNYGKWALGAYRYMGQLALRVCGGWDKWAIGANEHFGANGYMGQMGIEGKWVLGQMGIRGKGHFGAKERSGTNEHWNK